MTPTILRFPDEQATRTAPLTASPAIAADDSDGPMIRWLPGNPLSAASPPAIPAEPPPAVAAWSGWTGDDDTPFAPSPRNWLPGSRERLAAWCDRIAEDLHAARARLLLRPHARHVLSDIPGVRSFLDARPDDTIGLLLDPAGMMEPAMLEEADTFLERLTDTLLPRADALLLRGAPRHEGENDTDAARPAPITEDAALADMLPRLLGALRPDAIIAVAHETDAAHVRDALARA